MGTQKIAIVLGALALVACGDDGGSANDAGVVDAGASDAAYTDAAVDLSYPGPCSLTIETLEGIETVTRYQYNEAGLVVRGTRDALGDGSLEYISETDYSATGKPIQTRSDGGDDGVWDKYWDYSYDSKDRLQAEKTDTDGDGGGDYEFILTFTYTADDRVATQDSDSDGDGDVDQKEAFYYTPGSPSWVLHALDVDNDGIVDSRSTNSYDASGRPTASTYDYGDDGILETRTSWTYEADWSTETHYQNEVVTLVTRTKIDADGKPLVVETDSDANGTVNSRETTAYDAAGRAILQETDDNSDGTLDFRIEWGWSDVGAMLWQTRDIGADGSVEQRTDFSYDSRGNLLRGETTGPDGNVYRSVVREYSCWEV